MYPCITYLEIAYICNYESDMAMLYLKGSEGIFPSDAMKTWKTIQSTDDKSMDTKDTKTNFPVPHLGLLSNQGIFS